MAASAVLATRERFKGALTSPSAPARDLINLEEAVLPPRELIEIEEILSARSGSIGSSPSSTLSQGRIIHLPGIEAATAPHPLIERLRSIPGEIISGVKLAAKILTPAWLLLWIWGTAADQIATAVGMETGPAVTRPISSAYDAALRSNSTEALNIGSVTQDQAWAALQPTRNLLSEHSPALSGWFQELYASGKIKIQADEFSDSHSRYSDARKWSGELVLYPEFFGLSDGEKIVVLRHEHSHFTETLGGYVSNSLRPQVLAGATLRFFGAVGDSILSKYGYQAPGWGGSDTAAAHWQYDSNLSEKKACVEELKSAAELGVTPFPNSQVPSDIITDTPLQEIGGIGLAALLLLRRRRRSTEDKAPELEVVSGLAPQGAARAA